MLRQLGHKPKISGVWVNGLDVYKRCYQFDDEGGWADCYVYGVDGRFIRNESGKLVSERLHGSIRFVFEVPKLVG